MSAPYTHPELQGDANFRAWATKSKIVGQPRARAMLLELIDGASQGDVAQRFQVTRSRANNLWVRCTRSFSNEPATEKFGRLADIPIEHLHLPVRAERCLKREGIQTVGDLARASACELLRAPNFGKTSMVAVREALAFYGLGLCA